MPTESQAVFMCMSEVASRAQRMEAALRSTVMVILLTLLIKIEGKLQELGVLCIIESLPLSCHLP